MGIQLFHQHVQGVLTQDIRLPQNESEFALRQLEGTLQAGPGLRVLSPICHLYSSVFRAVLVDHTTELNLAGEVPRNADLPFRIQLRLRTLQDAPKRLLAAISQR